MSEKKTHALYSVIFEDNTNFQGGNSYFETKWKDLPNKKIKRIFVRLPGGDFLTLASYDKYFYMVESTKDWARINVKNNTSEKINQNTPKLEYFYIMGKKDNLIVSYRISLKVSKDGDRYKLGDITKRIYTTDSIKIQQWGLKKDMWK